MNDSTFERMFKRIEYFYNIHKNSFHVKIANLAFEEYILILLEIIKLGGWEWLKDKILSLENRKLQQQLLILLTPIDLEYCKNSYSVFLRNKVPEYLEVQPLAWNHFVNPEYLGSTKKLLLKINRKYKLGLSL